MNRIETKYALELLPYIMMMMVKRKRKAAQVQKELNLFLRLHILYNHIKKKNNSNEEKKKRVSSIFMTFGSFFHFS